MSSRVTPGDTDGNYEIWVMNADGSGQMQITFTASPFHNVHPAFSPDGSKIVFESNRPPSTTSDIWVMNVDGSGRKQLSNPPPLPLADEYPAWSPDGTKMAFFRGIDSIWVMNAADGSNPVDITQSQPNSDTDFEPNWQPLRGNPVGGVVLPINTLAILAPFLAIAGLVVSVSAVVAVKRRRD